MLLVQKLRQTLTGLFVAASFGGLFGWRGCLAALDAGHDARHRLGVFGCAGKDLGSESGFAGLRQW